MHDFAHLIYGIDYKVPTNFGKQRYINLDNAASTPPFCAVIQKINEAAALYSSVHRGSGYKSKYSTEQYEATRKIIANFVGADLEEDVVIFTKNTTEALNKMEHYLPYLPGKSIIFTSMEHHSNELPWQKHPHYCLPVRNGQLDLDELETLLRQNYGLIKLVAVTGASNVTGYTPPIYTIAELAHNYGAKILVDGAQLLPHRPVNKRSASALQHLDFLAFSGHKIYAPFGAGVLIGPKEIFAKGTPSQVGGGTVKGIYPNGIIWNDPPDNEEAGSPNVLGVLSMATALETITTIGWPRLLAHERQLTTYTLARLSLIPEVTVYEPQIKNRLGVISFNVAGFHHQQVAEFLANNYGIGVRSGCFCARRYVASLLSLDYRQFNALTNPQLPPGMVRVSFGCYNQIYEIDMLIEGIKKLIKERPSFFN